MSLLKFHSKICKNRAGNSTQQRIKNYCSDILLTANFSFEITSTRQKIQKTFQNFLIRSKTKKEREKCAKTGRSKKKQNNQSNYDNGYQS